MYSIKIIRHSDISKADLDEIIKIKSAAWPYSYNKQLGWLKANLKDSDLHLLLLKNNEAVAYLNLIDIEIEIDTKFFDAFGVGNVCAIEKGKGYGKELIKQTNKFMLKEKKIGLLFCKKELVNFYKKYRWTLLNKNQLLFLFNSQNIETMIFNVSNTASPILYKGKPF